MKKIVLSALLIVAILMQSMVFVSAVSSTSEESFKIVDDTFDTLTEGAELTSVSGWRLGTSGYATIFESRKAVIDEDDNNTYIRIASEAADSHWDGAQTYIEREIPRKGEGVYEISYRVNPGDIDIYFYDIFSLYGYVDGEGTKKILTAQCQGADNLYFQFWKWDGAQYSDTTSSYLQFAANTWYDVTYIVDTVNDTATVEIKSSDGTESRRFTNRQIASVDGLDYLRLRLGTKKDAYTGVGLSFDDVKIIKKDMEYDILLDYDFDNMDTTKTIFAQDNDEWSLVNNNRPTTGLFDVMPAKVDGVDGQVLKLVPRSTITNSWASENEYVYIDIPRAGEGQYEVSYRINLLDKTTTMHRLFDLWGYKTDETGAAVNGLMFMNLSSAMRFYDVSNITVNPGSTYVKNEYTDANIMSKVIPANTWVDVVYSIDTVSKTMTVEWKVDGAEEYTWKYSGIGDFDGISRLVLQHGAGGYDSDGNFVACGYLLDDFKVKKLKNWFDGNTDMPVTSLSELTEAEDGTKTLKYVSHYHNNKKNDNALDVYLGLYDAQDKLISAEKKDVTLDLWLKPLSGNKKTLTFTIPAGAEISYAKIMKWQDGTHTPISKFIDVPVE